MLFDAQIQAFGTSPMQLNFLNGIFFYEGVYMDMKAYKLNKIFLTRIGKGNFTITYLKDVKANFTGEY